MLSDRAVINQSKPGHFLSSDISLLTLWEGHLQTTHVQDGADIEHRICGTVLLIEHLAVIVSDLLEEHHVLGAHFQVPGFAMTRDESYRKQR